MAFMDGLHTFEASLAHSLRESLQDARRHFLRRRSYRRTVRELSELSDRELDDLGLARANIPAVAWDAALKS